MWDRKKNENSAEHVSDIENKQVLLFIVSNT